MPRFVAKYEQHIYAHITHMSTYIRHVPLPCRQTSTQVTRCCYGSRLRAIDIAYVAMKRRFDLISSEERKDRWLPARQSLSGKRMFLPHLGSGDGRGLINVFWSTETLLFEKAKWAVLLKTAESDEEMKEGVHYEFTDWKPTSILFARGKRNPIMGMGRDDARALKATKIILHVGEIHPSFRIEARAQPA